MLCREVTDQVEWPRHWGKATGVGGERSSHAKQPHVSELLDLIEADLGTIKGGWDETSLTVAAELGFSWEGVIEDFYARRFGEQIERPGEVCRDNIVGSPDGLLREVLHEYKLKYSSSDKFVIGEQRRWLMQVKSYCAMLGVRQVRFWVFFVVGNWKFGKDRVGPHPKVFDVEFTQQEVDDQWQLMKRYRKIWLGNKGASNE